MHYNKGSPVIVAEMDWESCFKLNQYLLVLELQLLAGFYRVKSLFVVNKGKAKGLLYSALKKNLYNFLKVVKRWIALVACFF